MLAERVPLSGRLALLAAALLVTDFLLPRPLMAVYAAALVYLVIWLAYAPCGPLAFYNRVGDYSYGTYVYAFPIGQCVAAWVPGATATTILLLAAPLTLAFAIPSWHLMEERLLRLKPQPGRVPSGPRAAQVG